VDVGADAGAGERDVAVSLAPAAVASVFESSVSIHATGVPTMTGSPVMAASPRIVPVAGASTSIIDLLVSISNRMSPRRT